MKKIFMSAIFMAAILFTSCNNVNNESQATDEVVVDSIEVVEQVDSINLDVDVVELEVQGVESDEFVTE